MGRSSHPFWATLGLLVGTLALVRLLPPGREGALSASLETFPPAFGQWREVVPDGWDPPGRPPTASATLFRAYRNGSQPPVALYVAYWKRQEPGELAFTARRAAPGRGWDFVREDLVRLPAPSRWGPEVEVTRTLYERRGERQLVTYWYIQPGRRTIGSRYWGRAWMLWDYLVGRRSDVALIRVATSADRTAPWGSFELHRAFIREALPALERHFQG